MAIDIFQVGAQLGAPASKVSNVRYDNSGQQAVARESSQTGRIIQAGVEHVREQIIRTDVLQANNEYVKRTNDLRMQLMQKKEKGALDIVGEYEAGERKIRSELMAQSPQSVKYGKGAMLFDYSTQQTDNANRRVLGQYRAQQFEAWQNTTYENNQNQITTTLMQNPNDPQALKDAVNKTIFSVEDIFGTYGEERVELETNKALGRLGSAVIKQAIVNQDYTESKRLVRYFNDVLTPDQRNSFNYIINQKEQLEDNYIMAKQLLEQFGSDEEGARAFIDNMGKSSADVMWSAEGSTWIKKNGVSLEGTQYVTRNGIADLGEYYKKITGEPLLVTSGTDSGNLHVQGERSHGGGWKVDVASDWLENPENRAKFIQYAESKGIHVIDEYSNPSAKSTAGHLDLDFTDYKDGDNSRRIISFEDRESIFKTYKNMKADSENRIKAQNDLFYKNVNEKIYTMHQQGVPYESVIEWVKTTAGANVEAGKKMITAADYFYDSNDRKASDVEMSILKSRLAAGTFPDYESLMQTCNELHLSADQKYIMQEEYSKYKNNKGIYKHDLNNYIKDGIVGKENSKAKKSMWTGVEMLLQSWITEETERRGREPAPYEIIEKGKEFMVKQPLGSIVDKDSWLGWRTEVNYAPATLAMAGIKEIQQADDYYFRVVMKNGEIKVVDPDELKEIVGE
jgi:hypothetical protein